MQITSIRDFEEYEIRFASEGIYEIELIVDDGIAVSSDSVIFDVSGDLNGVPLVDLGEDQDVIFARPANIFPVISDDDLTH